MGARESTVGCVELDECVPDPFSELFAVKIPPLDPIQTDFNGNSSDNAGANFHYFNPQDEETESEEEIDRTSAEWINFSKFSSVQTKPLDPIETDFYGNSSEDTGANLHVSPDNNTESEKSNAHTSADCDPNHFSEFSIVKMEPHETDFHGDFSENNEANLHNVVPQDEGMESGFCEIKVEPLDAAEINSNESDLVTLNAAQIKTNEYDLVKNGFCFLEPENNEAVPQDEDMESEKSNVHTLAYCDPDNFTENSVVKVEPCESAKMDFEGNSSENNEANLQNVVPQDEGMESGLREIKVEPLDAVQIKTNESELVVKGFCFKESNDKVNGMTESAHEIVNIPVQSHEHQKRTTVSGKSGVFEIQLDVDNDCYSVLRSNLASENLYPFILCVGAEKIQLIELYPNEGNPSLKLTVVIEENFQARLFVHRKEVVRPNAFWIGLPLFYTKVETVKKLLDKIKSSNVCTGNPDQFTGGPSRPQPKSKNSGYREENFGTSYSSTIRSTSCQLLINNERCLKCCDYRKYINNRKMTTEDKKRGKFEFVLPQCSLPSRLMSTEMLITLVDQQKKYIKELNRQIDVLEGKPEKQKFSWRDQFVYK